MLHLKQGAFFLTIKLMTYSVFFMFCFSSSLEAKDFSNQLCQFIFRSPVSEYPFLNSDNSGEFFGMTTPEPGRKKNWRLYLRIVDKSGLKVYTSNLPILRKTNSSPLNTAYPQIHVIEYRGYFLGLDRKSSYWLVGKVEYKNINPDWFAQPQWKESFAILTLHAKTPEGTYRREIHRLTGTEAVQSIKNLAIPNPG